MIAFIFRKLFLSIVLITVVLVVNFTLLRLTPGNPYETQRFLLLESSKGKGLSNSQQRELDTLRNRLGIYYDPAPEAFAKWAGGVVRLDFGNSVMTGQPFTPELMRAALSSFWLLFFATLLGLVVGVGLGLYTAYRPYSWQDNTIKIITLVIIALPGWYMIRVVNNFNDQIRLLIGKDFSILPGLETPFQPIFFLGAILLALFWGQTRSQAISVLRQDYVRTARAKGLPPHQTLSRYVLRNSLSPIISIFSGLLPFVLASQILIERFTGWDGLSRVFLNAASARDYTVLMGVFTLLVFVCVLCSFLAEVAYAFTDPKIREKYQKGIQVGYTKPKEIVVGNPQRKWQLRSKTAVGVGLVLLFLTGLVLVIVNPFAEKIAQPNSVVVTATPKTTFEDISIPGDAKVLLSDIQIGARRPFLPPDVFGGATPEPVQDPTKETKRTVFSTRSSLYELTGRYQDELKAQGWVASITFKTRVGAARIDYVFEKDDKFVWLSASTFRQLTINQNQVEQTILEQLTQSDNVARVVQGFRPTSSSGKATTP